MGRARDHDRSDPAAAALRSRRREGPAGAGQAHPRTGPRWAVRAARSATRDRARTIGGGRRHAAPRYRAQRSRVLGELADKWFAENTFSSSEFADLRRLVDAKERQNLRISVGLPTLNEEATIRKVIRAIRSRLVERVPLVDELVVIDSRSEDRTREIAEEEGEIGRAHV